MPNGLFLLLCAAIAVSLLWDTSTTALVAWVPASDYWAQVAVLQHWLQYSGSLVNPLVNDTALSPDFVPLFWALADIGRLLGLDAIQLMTAAAIINFLLLATGLRLFLSDYFRHAWTPFIGVLVLFFCWGVAGSGPGLFQLRNFLHIAGDPSTFAFALSLVAFWVTMRLLRSEVTLPVWATALLLLVALGFVSHPLTGLFCVTACVLLVATEFSSSKVARLVALAATFGGLAAAELWPFFSVWKLVLGLYGGGAEAWSAAALLAAPLEQVGTNYWSGVLYDPSALLGLLGVSLLGVVALFRLMQRGEQPFIVYGALLMLLPYALNLLFDIPLAHRFLLFAVFFLQLALIWGWLRLISAWSEIPRPFSAAPLLLLSVLGGVALLVANAWLVQQEKQGRVFAAHTLQLEDSRVLTQGASVPGLYRELLEPLADDAVVLADPVAGWPVPAFRGRVVSLLNPNPMLPDMHARMSAGEEFLQQSPEDLQRVATVQRYDISHVLVNRSNPQLHASLQPWLNSYSRLVAERGNYRMYELAAALHTISLPEPEPEEPVVEAVADTVEPQPSAAESRPQPERPARGSETPGAASGEGETADQEADAPRSFGAPIAAPVLDPERHGG